MTILFNEVFKGMAVIPDTMPWRLYIDMDEGDCKREDEDFGLRLMLEYASTRHYLMDSDSVRDGEFYSTVQLEDVEELFESIIHEACEWVTDPDCTRLSLCHIVEKKTMEHKDDWRKKYKLTKK